MTTDPFAQPSVEPPPPLGPGIYPRLPDKEYRALPRLSNSILGYGNLDQGYTMAHLKAAVDGQIKYDSEALAFGRALHVRLLEPKRFKEEYALCPKLNMSKNVDKATWAQWQIDNKGREPLLQEEIDKCEAIVKAVRSHEDARKRVACVGGFEVSVLWDDKVTGLPMKARLDKWIDGSKPQIILDLKGMRSLSTHNLQRDVYKYGYHIQAAIYTDGIKAVTGNSPRFYFLFVEKEPPYCVRLVKLDSRAISIGRRVYRGILHSWKDCLKTGEYPAWGSNIETLELPAWVLREWETMKEEDSQDDQ